MKDLLIVAGVMVAYLAIWAVIIGGATWVILTVINHFQ